MSTVSLFCEIHDFFMMYETHLSTQRLPDTHPETRGRPRRLHSSEVMTILIAFHQNNYRTFKHFYEKHICVYYLAAFPNLVSYSRFVQLKKEVLRLLTFYLSTHAGTCSGLSFVDSTRLWVCDNKRISSHKVFAQKVSERGKTSMGWFYGFKLHLIINDTGDILDVALTPGNIDDRRPLWGMNPDTPLHGRLTEIEGISLKTFERNSTSKGSTWFTKSERTWTPWTYRHLMKCC